MSTIFKNTTKNGKHISFTVCVCVCTPSPPYLTLFWSQTTLTRCYCLTTRPLNGMC